jgi:hypothetical protein
MTAFSEQYGRVCGRRKTTVCNRGHDVTAPGARLSNNACRVCQRENIKARRKSDPKRFAKYRRAQGLRDNYGVTLERYNELFQAQGGTCAICHRPPNPTKSLAVDHDHQTGTVRGLLCDACNMGLGMYQDDVLRLENAISYLKRV